MLSFTITNHPPPNERRDNCRYLAYEVDGLYCVWVIENSGVTQNVSKVDPNNFQPSQKLPVGITLKEYCKRLWSWVDKPPIVGTISTIASPPIGILHPRIWRSPVEREQSAPDFLKAHDRSAFEQSLVAVRGLVSRLLGIFGYIEPATRNFDAYGHEIRALLILAATELESAWKGILRANGYTKNAQSLTTRDYVKLHPLLGLEEYKVEFPFYSQLGPVAPFAGWNPNRSTQSLGWYDAYNAVKHDRESALARGTLRHAIEAVAACVAMIHAQFGPLDDREAQSLTDTAVTGFPPPEPPTVYLQHPNATWKFIPLTIPLQK